VLGLDALPDYDEVVQRQFEAFIQQHSYNANQINFIRVVQTVVLQQHHLQRADLYETPFSNFGNDAVDHWFTPREVDEVLEFAGKLAT
jgi:type I restriction enzyme, R subunit